MSRGHTLFELTIALSLLAMLTAIAAAPLRRYRDAAAVVAAREAVAGLIVRTRAMAVASGGASLHLQADPPGAWLVVHRDTVEILTRVPERVAIDLGRRDVLTLAYDEVGLGRIASATIRFERGEARRELIVASFGRLRRR
jgi:type II secretory pathway pseudopilin PulG